jgi:enoyl-[acyl-carrier-protein] reductase (NADH)
MLWKGKIKVVKGVLSKEKIAFGIHKYEEMKEGTYEEWKSKG